MTTTKTYAPGASKCASCGHPSTSANMPRSNGRDSALTSLGAHKERYPAFEPERVAEMFIAESPKTRESYCYRDISEFTKSIRKSNSFRSLCDSQS